MRGLQSVLGRLKPLISALVRTSISISVSSHFVSTSLEKFLHHPPTHPPLPRLAVRLQHRAPGDPSPQQKAIMVPIWARSGLHPNGMHHAARRGRISNEKSSPQQLVQGPAPRRGAQGLSVFEKSHNMLVSHSSHLPANPYSQTVTRSVSSQPR